MKDPKGQNKQEHTLRYKDTLAALKAIGMGVQKLPPLHLTEVGIDRLLTGIVGGWKELDNNPRAYVAQLSHYDSYLKRDSLVEAAYIFTASAEKTWTSYEIDEPAAEVLARYIKTGEIR